MQGSTLKKVSQEFLRGSYSVTGDYGIFCRHCREGHMLDAKERMGSIKMEDYVKHYEGCVVLEVKASVEEV